MQFSWDFNTTALIALGGQIVLLIVSLVRTSGKANNAFSLAMEAKQDAKDVSVQVGALTGNIAMLREQVAREHPNRQALQDMEERLTTEIHRVSDRIDALGRPSDRPPPRR